MIAATRFPWLSSESVFPLASLACFFPEQPKPKFSADDPAKLIARTEQPVFRPEMPFEQSGQYAAGTTFAEELVVFKGAVVQIARMGQMVGGEAGLLALTRQARHSRSRAQLDL